MYVQKETESQLDLPVNLLRHKKLVFLYGLSNMSNMIMQFRTCIMHTQSTHTHNTRYYSYLFFTLLVCAPYHKCSLRPPACVRSFQSSFPRAQVLSVMRIKSKPGVKLRILQSCAQTRIIMRWALADVQKSVFWEDSFSYVFDSQAVFVNPNNFIF